MKFTWRSRRQFFYIAIPLVPALLLGGFLTLRSFTGSSCDDGRINQGEIGIDCEGPCPRICQERIIPLNVEYASVFEAQPGKYSLVALVENRNPDLIIRNLNYHFDLYAEYGELVDSESGSTEIPSGSTTAVFLGPIDSSTPPDRVKFSFDVPDWEKSEFQNASYPEVVSKELITPTTSPRVESLILNPGFSPISQAEIVAIVKNEGDNAIGASRTFVDIPAESETNAIFTWSYPFSTTTGVCQQPVDVVLLIDRSGSMNELNDNPPEPLTSVKTAASRFVELFSSKDKVGVVSFATDTTTEASLGSSSDSILNNIENILVTPEEEEGYTNIAQALADAENQFGSNSNTGSNKATILLTDGRPTFPIENPEEATEQAADSLRQSGVSLYIISLGNRVELDWLSTLATSPSHVFQTSDASRLTEIYNQIATTVCERAPYIVDIYPRVPLSS